MSMRWLVAISTVAVIAGCPVTYVGDMEVSWSVDNQTSPSLCTTYGIANWRVHAEGRELRTFTYACGGFWSTGTDFFDIEEGAYTVWVEALLNSGGTVSSDKVTQRVDSLAGVVTRITALFTASDFAITGKCGNGTCDAGETTLSCPADCSKSCGNGTCDTGETSATCPGDCPGGGLINVYWAINGTVDGTDKGTSWDTCAEVGVTSVFIALDGGTPQSYDCYTMPAKVSAALGQHTVAMTLHSPSGAATTTASATVTVGTNAPAEIYADFYFSSFLALKNTQTGTYLFDTSYEGKSCTQTTPQVYSQVTLLKLNGSPVSPIPDVCGPDDLCVKCDGAAFGKCYGIGQTQDIANLKWGFYKLKLQGTLGASAGYDVCWESKNSGPQMPEPWPVIDNTAEVDILVGAGTANPVDPLDLVRVSSTGSCM